MMLAGKVELLLSFRPSLDGLPVLGRAFPQRHQHVPHHPFLPDVIVALGWRVRWPPARRGKRAIERRRLALLPRRRR